MKRLLLTLCLSSVFLFNVPVKANCTNEEKARLKKEASQVKMVYEEASEVYYRGPLPEVGDEEYELTRDYFKLVLSNISEEMYVIIKNDQNKDEIYVPYSVLLDGVYKYDVKNIKKIIKWTYDVYSTNSSECKNEKLFTGYLTTPKLNPIYYTSRCTDVTDLAACEKYLKEDLEEEALIKSFEDYQNKKEEQKKLANQPWYKKILRKVKEHKIIVGGITIMIIGSGVALVLKKKKKESNLK